jgi:predicted dehydrogenase
VTGSARISFPERVIGSAPRKGQTIKVNTPTHIAGVLDFARGPVATLVTSFDVWAAQVPRIEIYGSLGTLSVPDPNTFGGPVKLRLAGEEAWREVPLSFPNHENSRGLGPADMVTAIGSGRPHRASGALAWHVLDLMHAFHDASREGRHVMLSSQCAQPAALPVGLAAGVLDD